MDLVRHEEPNLKTQRLKRDARAAAIGLVLGLAIVVAGIALFAVLDRVECSGEYSPFLGSGPQTFAVYGCLAKDAGPLIGLKMRLGIYDPTWKPVIK